MAAAAPVISEAQIRDGVPVAVVASLTAALDISTAELLDWLHIAPRTWARRKQAGSFELLEGDRLARLARLVRRARSVLGGADEARAWMKSPQRALGGRTPLAASDTEAGAEAVFDLLGRIEHGVFT
jgi:putative toxin-antitoxin system antitoxin component (TIGR02293 family)